MKHLVRTIAAAGTATAATATYAHGADEYGHMMWDGGYGMVGGVMMLLFWLAIIVLVVLAVRWLSDNPGKGSGTNAARDVLRERFARGEIDEEEFERRRRALDAE